MLGRYYVFMTAFRKERTLDVNRAANDSLEQRLKSGGYEYDPVRGVFTGLHEASFCVQVNDLRGVERLLEIACDDFDQNCILVVDSRRNAFLCEGGCTMLPVGLMVNSEYEPVVYDYAYNIITKTYHYIPGAQNVYA